MKRFRDFLEQKINEENQDHEESHWDVSERMEKLCDRLVDKYMEAEATDNQTEMQNIKKQIHDKGQDCIDSLESRIRITRFRKIHPGKSLFSKEFENSPIMQDDYDVYKKD